MPSIFELYKKNREQIKDMAVIRLHGPDRQGVEKVTGKDWGQIVAPKDEDIFNPRQDAWLYGIERVQTFTYVNNHFEGSAPKTIEKLERAIQ